MPILISTKKRTDFILNKSLNLKKVITSNKLTIAMSFALVLSILLSSMSVFAKECDEIRHDVLRLHILANSNSDVDQQLKLKVRDRILRLDNELFAEAQDLNSAKLIATQKLDEIKQAAQDEICLQGYDYDVKIELANMYFSTREYDNFTLPAGKYDALRVTIGSGEGKNWWCVLYPPLCLPAASMNAELDDVLTKEQSEIVQNKTKYKFKFASVELYEKFKAWLNGE